MFNKPPNYTKLRTFGCLCYPWLRPYSSSKLQPHSKPCLFLGYSLPQSAYKCLDTSTNRMYISRHVTFVENIFPCRVHNSCQLDYFPATETPPRFSTSNKTPQPAPNSIMLNKPTKEPSYPIFPPKLPRISTDEQPHTNVGHPSMINSNYPHPHLHCHQHPPWTTYLNPPLSLINPLLPPLQLD